MPDHELIDQELVDLYRAETKQPEHVVRAFLAEDAEPPHRDVTDSIGFSFAQVTILDKAATKLPTVDVD